MKRMGLLAVLTGFVGLLPFGCGSDQLPGGSYSCDRMATADHWCADYTCTTSGNLLAGQSACTQGGGKTSTTSSCSHTGAVGGCQQYVPSNGQVCTAITWSYSGSASMVMSACTAAGGTFMTP